MVRQVAVCWAESNILKIMFQSISEFIPAVLKFKHSLNLRIALFWAMTQYVVVLTFGKS